MPRWMCLSSKAMQWTCLFLQSTLSPRQLQGFDSGVLRELRTML